MPIKYGTVGGRVYRNEQSLEGRTLPTYEEERKKAKRRVKAERRAMIKEHEHQLRLMRETRDK